MNCEQERALFDHLDTGAWWPGYSAALRDLSLADDGAAAIVAIHGAVVALGGNGAIYSHALRHDASLTLVRTLVVGDVGWTHLYSTSDWCEEDLWIAHALHHAAPVLAHDIAPATARQRTLVEDLAQHGFASALVIPSPSNFGSSRFGVLCIGAAHPGYFESPALGLLRPVARGLAMEVGDWCLRHLRAELIERARISASDLSLLRDEAMGRSSKLIAADLQATKSTVDSRFARLSQRLGVASRRDAVRLGRLYGLI
jgi:Bacterial regulatory proteins, luxR family/Autoinducer binding domain